jgi:hypothetical protein
MVVYTCLLYREFIAGLSDVIGVDLYVDQLVS